MTRSMRLFITCDANWESKVDRVLSDLVGLKFRQHFEQREYGFGLTGLSVILMCRDPSHNFKRRIKLSKKEKNLHLDIMLDLASMKEASPAERKREVAQRLFDEVPEVLSRYRIPDFDREAFIADFQAWVESIGWR